MRILRIVYDNRSAKAIAVLSGVVRMIPVASSLVADVEIVQEGMTGCDRTLIYKGGTIRPSGTSLEEAVPMLKRVLSDDPGVCSPEDIRWKFPGACCCR